MHETPWKHRFPQVYQKVRQIPLAKQLQPAQWMFLSFESGFISSTEYLPWAEKYYGLASLNRAFFKSPIFSTNPYQKYKNYSIAWGPQALPVYEWENVLFVACLDPHSVPSSLSDFPDQIIRPVLAHYEDLISGWNFCLEASVTRHSPKLNNIKNEVHGEVYSEVHSKMHSDVQNEVHIDPIASASATERTPIPLFNKESKVDVNSISKIDESQLLNNVESDVLIQEVTPITKSAFSNFPPPLTQPLTPPLPQSLTPPPPMSPIPTDSLTTPPQMSPTLTPPPSQSLAQPITTTVNLTTPLIEKNKAVESAPDSNHSSLNSEKPFELKLNPISPKEDILEMMNAIENSPEKPSNNLESSDKSNANFEEKINDSFEMPEGLSIGFSSDPISEPKFENPTPEPLQIPKAPSQAHIQAKTEPTLEIKIPQPTQEPPRSAHVSKTPPPPASSTVQSEELEEELTLGFTKAYQFYRNLMILKLKDNAVIPIRWDPSFKKAKSLNSIPLDQPSIFRIAAKTKKPFHGPITPNPINDTFVEHWFEGHKPKYLTIYPLFFEKQCVGLLLGASDEPLDRKDSLHLMESTAEMIEINFGANLVA